jgi:nitroreductase
VEEEMDVIEAIHGRRSVRSYKSKPVERALIECLILDAAQAPPPFHGQIPWVFNVIEGIEMVHARWNMPEIIVRKGLVGAGSIDLTSRSFGERLL